MKRFRVWSALAAGIALLVATAPVRAAERGVKVGVLTCNVASGWGFVVGSSKDVRCTYAPSSKNAKSEKYTGEIKKFGADIGYSAAGVMIWAVVAPTSDVKSGALAGEYVGATGGAAAGVGASANVLVGGLEKSIALQPVSIEGMTGVNVAAGVATLSLSAAS